MRDWVRERVRVREVVGCGGCVGWAGMVQGGCVKDGGYNGDDRVVEGGEVV